MFMLSIAILMLSVILRPQGPMGGAYSSVELCLKSVIPSLFPIFVLNKMLMSSGAATSFFTRFGKPFAKSFNLPPSAGAAIMLGFLSGYPTGAKIAEELYEKELISENELRRLTAFCNNAGPIFITGSVGEGLLKCPKAGIFLLVVHALSAISVGLIFRINSKKCRAKIYRPQTKSYSAAKLFTDSVSASAADISVICGYIIFFGMLMSYVNPSTALGKGIFIFSEMTNACRTLSEASISQPLRLQLISLALGWGGMCVHAQSFAVIKHKKTYLAGKLLQGMLAFLISKALLLFVRF